MTIVWVNDSLAHLAENVRYIKLNFGNRALSDFRKKLKKFLLLISQNPEMATKEPLLEGLDIVYRSYPIERHSRIVYYVQDDTIYIADFWNMLRSPENLVRGV